VKRLIPITASVAILAVAAPFAANQWIEFSGRYATWKEDAELKRLQTEYAIADARAQRERAQAAANRQAWHKAADEFDADPEAYLRTHNIAWGSADWKMIRDYSAKRRPGWDGSSNQPLPLYGDPPPDPEPPNQPPAK